MTISLRCRYCGRPCKKKSLSHWFGEVRRQSDYERFHIERPRSRAEAQRLVNGEIIQTRWAEDAEGRYIERIQVWDGESYMDPFFCTDSCAAAMGRSVAKHHGFVTQSYTDAMEKARK